MRKGLCWIGWLMAFVLILTFPLVASARIVVGYTPSDWDPADFHGMFGEGIEMGLRELGVDYEFLIRAAGDHTGHEIQLSIVEDFIAEGVDYVVINPTDPQAQRTSYEKVINAGIPLIIGNYRELLPEEW